MADRASRLARDADCGWRRLVDKLVLVTMQCWDCHGGIRPLSAVNEPT